MNSQQVSKSAGSDEPLSKQSVSLKLYQPDDDSLRPLGKGMATFIREAVREKLERDN